MTHFVLLAIGEKCILEKKILAQKKFATVIVYTKWEWVLQGKNYAAQFFIEKYLWIQGGDSATPLLAKCLL